MGEPLRSALGRAQQEQAAGQYAEAAVDYKKAVQVDRRTAEIWANLGLMQNLAGDFAGSATSLRQAVLLKPALFAPHLFLGLDEIELCHPDAALAQLDLARKLQPADPQVRTGLGRAYLALGRPAQAVEAYEAATQAAPDDKATWFGLGTAAMSAIEQDGSKLAIEYSDSAWARALYADELLKQGRTVEAVDTYHTIGQHSSAADRATLEANLAAGRKSAQIADNPALVTGMEKVLAALEVTEAPSDPVVCSSVKTFSNSDSSLACLYWQGRNSDAARLASKRVAKNSADPQTLFWAIKSNERVAVAALDRFEQLAPHAAATFDVLGDLYRRREQPDSALLEYAKALAVEPRDPVALMGKAAALLALGQMEEAITASQEALQNASSDPQLNLILAEALVDLHRYKEAEPDLRIALAGIVKESIAHPATLKLATHAHALLGRVLAAQGDVPGAILELKLGEPSDTDGSISYQLSRLYRRAGNLEEARKAEARTLELQAKRREHAATAVGDSSHAKP